MFSQTEKLSPVAIGQLVEVARNAELRREFQPLQHIFGNLHEFFQHVLGRFKKYLVSTWIASRRIALHRIAQLDLGTQRLAF